MAQGAAVAHKFKKGYAYGLDKKMSEAFAKELEKTVRVVEGGKGKEGEGEGLVVMGMVRVYDGGGMRSSLGGQ